MQDTPEGQISPAQQRFDALVARLVTKIRRSQTPVPGFVLGVSGTDSVVAACALYDAMQHVEMPAERLLLCHFVTPSARPAPMLVVDHSASFNALQWLNQERCPGTEVRIGQPRGGNYDPQRWAELHTRALYESEYVQERQLWRQQALPPERQRWVCGTTNATEWELGTYSMVSQAVSLQPLRSLWKTDVLQLCAQWGVPQPVQAAARQPDCLCGRDEVAAEHPELIDRVLRNQLTSDDILRHALLLQVQEWVRQTKAANSFKRRTPYVV